MKAIGAFFLLVLLLFAFFSGILMVFMGIFNIDGPEAWLLPLGIALVGAVFAVLWDMGRPAR